ncbi:hypothetical protein [Microcoleus sp. BROC3]|uniref:hypothetical protein n=1 Tax=Microcoleus sp. BROC3 TaxID=3055323 RepID=UPI002FD4056C
MKKPGLFGIQCVTPDLFRLVVLSHHLIESTVTDRNLSDNKFVVCQRAAAESAIDFQLKSLK